MCVHIRKRKTNLVGAVVPKLGGEEVGLTRVISTC